MARATRLSSRIDFLLFIGCLIAAAVALVLPLQMRDPLAELLRRSVVAPLVNLQSNAERWHAAWQLSEERTARLDSAVMRGFNANALQGENDELRKLLGLGARLRTGFVPAEAVHNAVREDVVTTLTLTAGTRAGIKVYSPVVSPEGVVGLVQTADPTISIAILFSHPDFRASAMSGDGTSFGIVYPHLQQSLGGSGEYLLELHGVPFRTTLPAGTMIYTSGLGGAFPRGIPIGSVLRELKTAEGWTRTYLLQPSVNPAKVNTVMVLTSQRSGQKMDNVWQMVARVDSAARSVASAGDSISRRAAADSAKRAAADSTRKVGALHPAADSAARADSAKRSAAQTDSAARADSARAARAARREAARRDSIRRDAARRDSIRRDSIRRDTTRRDTTRRDTTTHRP
ncbi:MAG TPA: rod shape-determining protein MreC [Gemmatimonadaceae bacterium]|nr:rod shape-determining protein MreC [Gemmatimonadaceae bacterium]